MSHKDKLYDSWAMSNLEFKAIYSWCQFCKNNINHICKLTGDNVDDDECCNECEIDDNKIIKNIKGEKK